MAEEPAAMSSRATTVPATRQIRLLAVMLLAADLLLVTLFFGLHQTGFRLDFMLLGAGRSLPIWYAAMKLLVLGQALMLLALRAPGRAAPIALASSAALFVLLSADRVALLLGRWAWLVALLAVAAALLGRHGSPSGATTAKPLLGGTLLLGGAGCIGAAPSLVADPAALTIAMGLGRGFGLLGTTLLLWSAVDELVHDRPATVPSLGAQSLRTPTSWRWARSIAGSS